MFSTLDSVLDYYVAFLLMALGSSVGGFLTVATTVVNWFERRRGVAMGIAMSGFGIGGLLVPAIAWSLTELGWRPTAFISGVVIIVLGVPLGQLFRHRPEQYGYLPDGDSPDEAGASEATRRNTPQADHVEGFTAAEAMRTPAFWLLSLGHSLALLTVGAVSLHLVPHIQESVGLSLTAASGAVAVMTVFNIVGQIGGGFLGDRFSKRMLAALAMLVHSVAMLTLAFASSVPYGVRVRGDARDGVGRARADDDDHTRRLLRARGIRHDHGVLLACRHAGDDERAAVRRLHGGPVRRLQGAVRGHRGAHGSRLAILRDCSAATPAGPNAAVGMEGVSTPAHTELVEGGERT